MDLSRSILCALAYFDIFDQPLTSFEIWKYLWNPKFSPSFEQFKNELQNLITTSKIAVQDGFYFLVGREKIILLRKEHWQISKKKLDKTRVLVKFFRHIPYLRGIFVCNRVASSTASVDSDIDLFIIAQAGRLWTVRFLVTLFLKIFGLRPSKKQSRDKFCLSFYVGSDNLSLQDCLLKEKNGWPDIHFIYWLADFLPLYDEACVSTELVEVQLGTNTVSQFIQANKWIKQYLPNLELTSDSSTLLRSSRSPLKFFIETVSKIIRVADFRERVFKAVQLHLMPEPLRRAAQEPNTNVVISDQMLKFHLNDRREKYRDKFLEKLTMLDIV